MPDKDYTNNEFNPTIIWKDKKNRNGIKYVDSFTINKKNLSPFSTSILEIDNKDKILSPLENFSYWFERFENNLQSEIVKETIKQLKNDCQVLHLVSRLLAFNLINLYEYRLEELFENSTKKLSSNLDYYSIIFLKKKNNSVSVNLNLDQDQKNQTIEYLENTYTPIFENNELWEDMAKALLTGIAMSAIEKMQLSLGLKTFNNMTAENRLKKFLVYFQEEDVNSPENNICLTLNEFSCNIVLKIINSLDLASLTLKDLNNILGFTEDREKKSSTTPTTESLLTDLVLAIPSCAPFRSAIKVQTRPDSWKNNSDGFAYSRHQAKSNSKNYIEHYISNPGDVELLPLEQAEQIINKFGFNTVKLHLIFAAHTMNQEKPWNSSFCLKGSDIVKYVGWDKRTDLLVHQKLNEIAKTAFILDCLLVKSVWIEGRNKKGEIDASSPTGRMWNVTVDRRGKKNLDGKIEKPREVYITVQPGLIFFNFLNKAGSQLRQALYQFGYLAQDILRIDPYHDELALRLAIHLTMESRVHTSGTYKVETLLKHLIPHTKIDKARNDTRRGYDLRQCWDNALKLLINLRWQVQFDKSYPEWLQPGNRLGKPSDARKMKIIEWLLQAKITIQPPEPIPELISAKLKPKLPSSKKKKKIKNVTGITSDQIRKGRNAKGWSQRKLAGTLDVSNALVGYWEKGKRTPSDEMEKKLRALLEIED